MNGAAKSLFKCFSPSPLNRRDWQNFLQRFAGGSQRIAWYPSCGGYDWLPLLYFKQQSLRKFGIRIPETYAEPDLWILSDLIEMNGGILHSSVPHPVQEYAANKLRNLVYSPDHAVRKRAEEIIHILEQPLTQRQENALRKIYRDRGGIYGGNYFAVNDNDLNALSNLVVLEMWLRCNPRGPCLQPRTKIQTISKKLTLRVQSRDFRMFTAGYYWRVKVDCHVSGTYEADVLYFQCDNVSLLSEFFLRHRIQTLTHIFWKCDGWTTGQGAPDYRVGGNFRFLLPLSAGMGTRWYLMNDFYAEPQEGSLFWPPELESEQQRYEAVVPLERLGPPPLNPPHRDESSTMRSMGFYVRK